MSKNTGEEFQLENNKTYCKQDVISANNEIQYVSKYFDTTNPNRMNYKNVTTEEEMLDCYIENQEKDSDTYKFDESSVNPDLSQDSGVDLHNSQESIDKLMSVTNENDKEVLKLEIDEKDVEPFVIEPFFNITPREMPKSPHNVVEEQFKTNPWVMLVATIFLTKTTLRVAKPFMKKFFYNFPTPLHVLETKPSHLEEYFETLGLRKRGTMIWKMSYQFISGKWRRASDLCGIGKYGEDAYRLFCLGHCDIEPSDRYLKLYLDWLKSQTDYTKTWSITDCERILIDPVEKYYRISLR